MFYIPLPYSEIDLNRTAKYRQRQTHTHTNQQIHFSHPLRSTDDAGGYANGGMVCAFIAQKTNPRVTDPGAGSDRVKIKALPTRCRKLAIVHFLSIFCVCFCLQKKTFRSCTTPKSVGIVDDTFSLRFRVHHFYCQLPPPPKGGTSDESEQN